MAKVYVDGRELEFDAQERLNGIQAAKRLGIEVPHYCWHPGLSVVASCRMCLVETGRKDPQTGQIQMTPKLVPACQTPATDGTVFVTDSENIQRARAMVEEDLLIRHPIDCPICDKAGECHLQDYHFQHGRAERRADLKPFTSRRRPVGDTVTLFVDRCVMCTRCVRFTREITGTSELMVANRGAHEEIDVFPGYPLANKMAGNVVDLCPVGALGDVDFLYSQRVWFMKRHASVCGGCATGCSVFVEENQDHVYRLKPRENAAVNRWWMCDDGRYGWKYIHAADRVLGLQLRGADEYTTVEWEPLSKTLESTLSAGHVAVVVSPFLTVEEAYLLAKLATQADPEAVLVLGPVPSDGQNETFPGGFTIQAEKCPNRRGVEAILRHFSDNVLSFADFVAQAPSLGCEVAWIAADYPTRWIDDSSAATIAAAIPQLIVQDLFDSPLWQAAHVRIPGVTFVERSGSFVNAQSRLQSFDWAIRPPAGTMVPGYVYWRLLGNDTLYRAADVLREIAASVSYFAAAEAGVPSEGVALQVPSPTTA